MPARRGLGRALPARLAGAAGRPWEAASQIRTLAPSVDITWQQGQACLVHPAAKPRISEQEYLDLERASDTKHELVNGELIAMAGASRRHNAIVMNLGAALVSRLRDTPCVVLSSDQRVAVESTKLFSYPDLTVVCGPARSHALDAETVINPVVLVEVLSPTTKAYDRGPKFAHYQRIETLRHYIVVSQDERRVEHYTRVGSREWNVKLHDGTNSLTIESLNIRIPLEEIYDKVELEP